MNIRIVRHQSNQGSALAVTLMTCGVMAILMGSYLFMVQEQRQSVARSQSWNQAMVVAEAGVEEALAQMNSGITDGNFAPSTTLTWWKNAGGGYYTNRISPKQFKDGGNDSYYSVSIYAPSVTNNPVITSTSYVPSPISKTWLSRKVRVQARPRPVFPVKGPMIVKQTFDANGNNVGTDSFDGALGPYNPATAGNNGDIVSLTTNAQSIRIGNGNINGSVHTPPGGTSGTTSDKTATIGASGKVGDTTWLAGSTSGFQTGHFKDDFALSDFPDVTLPNVTFYSPGTGTPVLAPDSLMYDYVLGNSGSYEIGTPATPANLSGSVYVGYPNTILYVTGNVSISGNSGTATTTNSVTKKGVTTVTINYGTAASQIHIADGASLMLYVGGYGGTSTSTTVSGKGIVNDSAQAKNFQYYGLPNNTTVKLSGNGSFFGTIYAPSADFELGGSGNSSVNDFTGSSITKTTKMTGNFNFHYDASLGYLTTLGGYDVSSWEEL